jgi:hypothetical protein
VGRGRRGPLTVEILKMKKKPKSDFENPRLYLMGGFCKHAHCYCLLTYLLIKLHAV